MKTDAMPAVSEKTLVTHDLRDLVLPASSGLRLAHRVRGPRVGAMAGAPVLILLHGVGSNEANMIDFAQQQDRRLAVISVRGPLTLGAAQYAWFMVRFSASGPVINAPQAERARLMLIEFIDGLAAAYGIDPKRVWIAGFSQGGIMSASVALTRPDKVKGFGILSGRILPEIAPQLAGPAAFQDLNAFVSHGIEDGTLPLHFGQGSRQWLQDRQVPLTYQEYPAGHELNESMQRDFGEWMGRQIYAA